ncbi:hypothetical protein RUM43_002046 [Polyplax serrata]|uniref:Uncharacterized protein n=1 Tax=Polyplax serrata TaxID=468196 RepID=A0AAN8NYA3_POLSC
MNISEFGWEKKNVPLIFHSDNESKCRVIRPTKWETVGGCFCVSQHRRSHVDLIEAPLPHPDVVFFVRLTAEEMETPERGKGKEVKREQEKKKRKSLDRNDG